MEPPLKEPMRRPPNNLKITQHPTPLLQWNVQFRIAKHVMPPEIAAQNAYPTSPSLEKSGPPQELVLSNSRPLAKWSIVKYVLKISPIIVKSVRLDSN